MLSIPVRSKCCEAPVKAGYRKIKNTNKRVQIWVCLNCKRKDVDLLPFVNGKVVRPTHFAEDSEEATLDAEEQLGYDRRAD